MQNNVQLVRNFELFEWTDICKPDSQLLNKISLSHGLDIFQIKDSMQPGHLPKFEKLPNYDFLILRAVTSSIHKGATTVNELTNKIAFFYNEDKIISVHRNSFSFLENSRKEYEDVQELLLHLINEMLESYHPPLAELDKKIEEFEKTIFLKDYTQISLKDLYFLKTQTRIIKKLLHLFQDVLNHIEIKPKYQPFFQDVKDSLLNLILNYDEVFENANGLLNTYHSVNAQKNNDVMKLLTVFSAFFLPLTFIVGVYGMNFSNMPELQWQYGYFAILGFMVVLVVLIYLWFKRKKILH